MGVRVTLRGDNAVAFLPLSPPTIRKGKTKLKGNKKLRTYIIIIEYSSRAQRKMLFPFHS